ncbi:hypothetical protein QPK87_10790 [Kamptonema cortianum]|nr:hypothetical protein [Geitlerinema splendidum]MDK3157060.1 hypothetical protein [Kamptonema cortianum]
MALLSAILAVSLHTAAFNDTLVQTQAPRYTIDNTYGEYSYSPSVSITRPGPDGQPQRGMVDIRVEVRAFPMDETEGTALVKCGGTCNGNVHDEHAECDTSCDTPCRNDRDWGMGRDHNGHIAAIPNHYNSYPLNDDEFEGQVAAMAETMLQAAGASVGEFSPRALSIYTASAAGTAMRDAIRFTNTLSLPGGDYVAWTGTYRIRMEHFQKNPCTKEERTFGRRKHRLMARPILTLRFSSLGNRTEEVIRGAEIEYGQYFIPVGEPIAYADPKVECACEPSSVSMGDGGIKIGEDFTPIPQRPVTQPGRDGGYAAAMNSLNLPEYVSLNITGEDMNYANVSFTCSTGQDAEFYLPAGSTLIPNDPSIQDMITTEPVRFALAKHASLHPAGDIMEQKVRVMCLQMPKKEPTKSTKFAPALSTDPRTSVLAQLTGASRFSGPWDQARLWMLTDNATFDEINKRLSPKLSPRRFIMMMRESNDAGVLNDKTLKDEKLLDPKVLLTPGTATDDVHWYVSAMALVDPNTLAKSVRDNMRVYANMAKGEDAESRDHVMAISTGLLSTADNALIGLGLQLLADSMNQPRPQAKKETFERVLIDNLWVSEPVALGVIRAASKFQSDIVSHELKRAKELHPSKRVRDAIRL